MASESRDWRSLWGRRRVAGPGAEVVTSKPVRRTTLRDPQGRSLIARTRVRSDILHATQNAVALLSGGKPLLRPGESPLILPRFGSAFALLSTAPDFLQAVVRVLLEHGADSVRVLDARSDAYPQPVDLERACERAGCELVRVQDGPWVRVAVGAGTITVPRAAYESDRLVFLPAPLANSVTRFSMGLALAQQLLLAQERPVFYRGKREERLVELNMAVRPWLLLMDARKALVSDEAGGLVREPGYVLASGDPIALDVFALKLLKGYPAKNKLTMPAWTFPQVVSAISLGLGAGREDDVHLLEG